MHKQLNGINWWTNNLIPIVTTLLVWAAAFGVLNTKVDYLIQGQLEMKNEFRSWKVQWEERLGQAEIDIAVLRNK